MQELDDITLLREYAQRDSEEAFATLVARHVNKVHSVALRHTRNAHQAEEITQAVFVILARKARHLGRGVILSGWLYQTARLTAVTHIRSEIRRGRREQEAYMQSSTNEMESDVWPQIAPLIDTAMADLSEADRHAVVLRYFDGKSMREVGAALGGSEDAAKMRLNRAVEKLRGFFSKRGIALSTAVLVSALSANSVQAAPAVLAKSITMVALTKGLAASGSTAALVKGALKLMAWTKMKTAVVVAVVLAGTAGTAVLIQHQTKPSIIVPTVESPAPAAATEPSSVAFTGYATPDATIKTMLWATSNGNTNAFLECLTPETKIKIQKEWKGKSNEILAVEARHQFEMMSAMKILDQTIIGGNRAVVTIQSPGNPQPIKMPFVKIGQDWKMAR